MLESQQQELNKITSEGFARLSNQVDIITQHQKVRLVNGTIREIPVAQAIGEVVDLIAPWKSHIKNFSRISAGLTAIKHYRVGRVLWRLTIWGLTAILSSGLLLTALHSILNFIGELK